MQVRRSTSFKKLSGTVFRSLLHDQFADAVLGPPPPRPLPFPYPLEYWCSLLEGMINLIRLRKQPGFRKFCECRGSHHAWGLA